MRQQRLLCEEVGRQPLPYPSSCGGPGTTPELPCDNNLGSGLLPSNRLYSELDPAIFLQKEQLRVPYRIDLGARGHLKTSPAAGWITTHVPTPNTADILPLFHLRTGRAGG